MYQYLKSDAKGNTNLGNIFGRKSASEEEMEICDLVVETTPPYIDSLGYRSKERTMEKTVELRIKSYRNSKKGNKYG